MSLRKKDVGSTPPIGLGKYYSPMSIDTLLKQKEKMNENASSITSSPKTDLDSPPSMLLPSPPQKTPVVSRIIRSEAQKEEKDSILTHVFKDWSFTQELIKPYVSLMNIDNFLFPENEKLNDIINSFHQIQNDFNLVSINNLLKIKKIPKRNSVNGFVVVTEINKNKKTPFNKILMKLPAELFANRTVDPPSYEYYIGNTLNQLRKDDVYHFSLTYGRLNCNLSKNTNEALPICNSPENSKSHILLQEYISAKENGDSVISLSKLIENFESLVDAPTIPKKVEILERNILNIMIAILITLQISQDTLEFTHYDLHLDNVLLIKLPKTTHFVYKYKNKEYDVYLDFFPIIIDLGRCHIKDASAVTYDNDKYIDLELHKDFASFQDMQKFYWKKPMTTSDTKYINLVNQHILDVLNNKQMMETNILSNLQRQNIEPTPDSIFRFFFMQSNDSKTKFVDFNIYPQTFNRRYDMFRFVMLCCHSIFTKMERNQIPYSKRIWIKIKSWLETAYPFYIPKWFILSRNHKSFSGEFNSPIELVDRIYEGTSQVYKTMYTNKSKIPISVFSDIPSLLLQQINLENSDTIVQQSGGAGQTLASLKIENLPVLPKKTKGKSPSILFMEKKEKGKQEVEKCEQTAVMCELRKKWSELEKKVWSRKKGLNTINEFTEVEPINAKVEYTYTYMNEFI
jgi:hypothetical protein